MAEDRGLADAVKKARAIWGVNEERWIPLGDQAGGHDL